MRIVVIVLVAGGLLCGVSIGFVLGLGVGWCLYTAKPAEEIRPEDWGV